MGHAVLSLQLAIIGESLQLPEGYQLIAAHFDMIKKSVDFLVESPDIPEAAEGTEFPQMDLHCQVEYYPAVPEHRQYTMTPKLRNRQF